MRAVPAEPALQPPDFPPAVRPGVLAVALAVLLPVAMLGVPLGWWARPDPPAALSPTAIRLEKSLGTDPEVIVLGASKVGTDLDVAVIAEAFASSRQELAPLNLSGTTAPVWYAILKNRVYGLDKKPKLILVYSTFDWALATRPTSEAERAVLLGQMGDEEEVLQRKVLGAGSGGATWDRVRRRRTEAHTRLLAFVRDAAVGVTLAPKGEADVVTAGSAMAAPALDALFGMEAGLDLSAAHRAIPIVEETRAKTTVSTTHLEDTLLPDFLAMAREHDAQIVFVHAPVRASLEVSFQVEPALLRDAVQAINDAGAGYVDLRELRLSDAAFGDTVHLNRVGRDALTGALVERLREMGVGGEGPLTPARLPVVSIPPTVTRVGSPPVLPPVAPRRGPRACGWEAPIPDLRALNDFALQTAGLGMTSPLLLLEDGVALAPHATRAEFDDACKGAFLHQDRVVKFSPTGPDAESVGTHAYTFALSDDVPIRTEQGFEAWWVYPGTSLTIAFAEGYVAPGAFGIVVDAVVFGEGAGAPVVRVDDGPEAPLLGQGLHRSAILAPAAPSGPWRMTVSAPPDGGWVLLRRVAYGSADDLRFVVGTPGETSVGILGANGTYAAAPAPLAPLGAPTPAEDGYAAFDISGLGVPDTKALYELASVRGCSPVRVLEDGASTLTAVPRVVDLPGAPGRYTHEGSTLTIMGTDGAAPGANGRAYTAVLDDTRRCRGLRWLYPGDSLTLTVEPNLLARLLADPTRVELGGAAAAEPVAADATAGAAATEEEGTIRIRVGDTVYLDERFPLAALASTPPAWTLDRPLPRGPAPITVELAIPPSAPYTLVTSLELSEPGDLPSVAPAPAVTPRPPADPVPVTGATEAAP